jgi:hypothetical protein
MTPKEFNRLPLSAKTGIVKDYGKLVEERNDDDNFTVQTYSVKTLHVQRTRFIEVWFGKKVQDVTKIKMQRTSKFDLI